MKKQSMIAMALVLTLLTGCFKNYDEVDVTGADISVTTSASVSDTGDASAENDPTEGSVNPSGDSTLAPVELDAWKMTTESETDHHEEEDEDHDHRKWGNVEFENAHQQKIIFDKEGNRFVGRLVLPEGASEKLPTVVILDFNPSYPNALAYNKDTVKGIVSNGMACFLIEAFGAGDSNGTYGTYENLSFDNVNELLTVLFANMDKIPGVDSSNVVLWVNSRAQLFAVYAMQDKCDRVKSIFLPGVVFTDGASLREHYPDKEKIPRDGTYDYYVDQMYDVDAEDFFKNISVKVYAFIPELEDSESVEYYERYMGYFPDKVLEQVGKDSDVEKGIYRGQGVIFEKIIEDLKAVFGI